MLSKKYLSKIVSIKNPIDGIYTLEMEPERGRYKYMPGQFLHLAIDNDFDGSGQWPDSRCFSIQSNPAEAVIRITYAIKGKFTQEIERSVAVGSQVWLKLPYGDLFTQKHKTDHTVFIAGGTGITPFLSLFTHESFYEYKHPKIYLGFRTQEHNVYQRELSLITNSPEKDRYVGLKIFYEKLDGIIDIESIYLENGSSSTYFISGPPNMIKDFRNRLMILKVPKENILSDDWE